MDREKKKNRFRGYDEKLLIAIPGMQRKYRLKPIADTTLSAILSPDIRKYY